MTAPEPVEVSIDHVLAAASRLVDVDAWFEKRAELIGKCIDLDQLPFPAASPLEYAIAQHLLEGCEEAIRSNDPVLLSWYRTTTPRSLAQALSSDGVTLTIAPGLNSMRRSELSDTADYILQPSTSIASPSDSGFVLEALSLTRSSGFGYLCDKFAPIVCLLSLKGLTDELHSWSISRLIGTVFLDFTGDAPVLGRDIVHEAGHNWLNLVLKARRVHLPDEQIYSPWRASARPVFGFLHACWSFPLTVRMSMAALSSGEEMARRYLLAYLDSQGPLMAAARQDFEALMREFDDRELADVLYENFRCALELTV